jgi:hypothetical protein
MQVIRSFLVVLLAAFTVTAMGQVAQVKGKASLAYKGKAVPLEVKNQVQQTAQLKAIEGYYAEAGEAESANFDAVRAKILENPDRFILDSTVLTEDDDVPNQKYTAVVRVSLNVANLRNLVKDNSAVAKTGRTEKSALSFVFVSRQVDSVKAFDDRVYKRAEGTAQGSAQSTAAQKTTESESVGKSKVSTSTATSSEAAGRATVKVEVETGGSTTRRASESTWRLIPSANLNAVFATTFSRAGFKVSDAAFVEASAGGKFKVAAVEDDYKSGFDLKPATLQAVATGMRTARVPYVALGTLDVGLADTDPGTGLKRVAVTVNARLFDVSQPIPDTLASVGPVQYAGVGPTEDEARGNALKLAANNAARELSSQMTNLGLR